MREIIGSWPENDYRYYLQHHGIQGQKWGIRNAEWYPIADYKAHVKRIGGSEKSEKIKSGKQGSLEALIALYVGGAVLSLGLAGANILHNKHIDKKIEKTKQKISDRKLNQEIDSKTGLPKRTDQEPVEKDLKNVNPMYKMVKNNTEKEYVSYNMYYYKPRHPEYSNNCVLCTIATEARRRGLDVMAKPAYDGMSGPKATATAFPGGKAQIHDSNNLLKSIDLKTGKLKLNDKDDDLFNSRLKKAQIDTSKGKNIVHAQATIENLSKEKNSRGGLFVTWAYGGGHAIQYEVRDGQVRLIDGQCNEIIENPKKVEQYLARTVFATSYRYDNLEIDKKKIKEYVE